MKTLIRGGIVCLEGGPWKGDLLVTNETITSLSESYSGDYDRLVEAEGMYVCPGGIDVHTHMSLQQSPRYRSCDDFYSGGAAAACGGTTTIIDHMSFGVPGAPLMDKFEEYRGLAADCPVDYSFHGVFTRVDGAVLEELREIITKKGFPSFKAYTTYAYPMEDRDLLQILHVIRETGGLLCVHAENDAITNLLKERFAAEGGLSPIHQALSRPAAAKAETVARLLRLAEIEL